MYSCHLRTRCDYYPPRRFPFAAVACGLMFGATVGGFGGGFSNDNLSSFCMCGFFGAKSGMPRGDFFFMALNLRLSQFVRPPICNHGGCGRYDDVPGTAAAVCGDLCRQVFICALCTPSQPDEPQPPP